MRAHGIRIRAVDTDNFPLGARNRQQNDVVLVLPLRGLAFGRKHADDGKRYVFDANRLANRIGVPEQIVCRRLAQHRNLVGLIHILLGKLCATVDRKLANGEIVGSNAINLRSPVVVSVDHLRAASDIRRRQFDVRTLRRNFFCVRLGQSHGIAGAQAYAGSTGAPRSNNDDVAADARDLVLNALGGARSNRYGGNHGCDADHDTQHGQCRAELVHRKRLERNANR